MSRRKLLFRPRARGARAVSPRIDITPEKAGWDLIRFVVRPLSGGARWQANTAGDEMCVVLLSGCVHARWGPEDHTLGPRAGVFGGYPHALYLPPGLRCEIQAIEESELAECRVPSTAQLEPRVIRPADCGFEIRGGGNATRQIVDILPPAFPADRLLICEVFTPSGNWSSYPPHKHDIDNPPDEADLEEIYYFRFRDRDGFGFHRIYGPDRDETVTVHDDDVVVVRDGYHPFVAAHGYDAYYLNVLAGSRRSMAATDDPRYAALRVNWPPPDRRVPLIEPPAELVDASGSAQTTRRDA